MKRKVIKQGHNTLTITLPKEWADHNNIKPGDELDLAELEEGLLLRGEGQDTPKSISLNVDGLGRLALAKLLIACFEQGFDTITLTFTRTKTKSWSHGNENTSDIINLFSSRLIGLEVLSQTPRSITLGKVSEKLIKFDSVLSRIFFLIEEYLQHLIDDMKTVNFDDLKEGENRHDNITKFVALASRMVLEDPHYTKTEMVNYFTILNFLDKVTDFIRYSYRNTARHKGKVSKETIALAEKAHAYIELYRHTFYKFDYKLIDQLDSMRGDVKDKFMASTIKKEACIASNLDALVETLHGIIKSMIALELAKSGKAHDKQVAV